MSEHVVPERFVSAVPYNCADAVEMEINPVNKINPNRKINFIYFCFMFTDTKIGRCGADFMESCFNIRRYVQSSYF